MDSTFGIQTLALNTKMQNRLRGRNFAFLSIWMQNR